MVLIPSRNRGHEKTQLFTLLIENGALIIQAHPFREASYIDHIRLFPRHVHGVETYNASRADKDNAMAVWYAKEYELLAFAGSDNHSGCKKLTLGGMQTKTPVKDENDFVTLVKSGFAKPFKNIVTQKASEKYHCEITHI